MEVTGSKILRIENLTTYWSIAHYYFSFFFNDTATTEIYTLSLHDALPIYDPRGERGPDIVERLRHCLAPGSRRGSRSEEHTSELQSLAYLVCRLLLEKKKVTTFKHTSQERYSNRARPTIATDPHKIITNSA